MFQKKIALFSDFKFILILFETFFKHVFACGILTHFRNYVSVARLENLWRVYSNKFHKSNMNMIEVKYIITEIKLTALIMYFSLAVLVVKINLTKLFSWFYIN